jgi:hypothetical protein
MMNNEDAPRGTPYQQGRRPYPSKFQDNRYGATENRYGQGENRYASNTGHTGAYGYNKTGGHQFGAGQYQQKKIDRFHRDPVNYSEKLVNLLKEIRDRLPAPPASAVAETESTNQNIRVEETDVAGLPPEEAAASGPVDETADQEEIDEESPGNS